MFCDLVGSTALASRLDVEELREIVGAYQSAATEEVQRFGGFVAKYMGDGILVYFGYPNAHEADAERAVQAGLALVEAVSRLEAGGFNLAIRIGVATGVVVVGDLIGNGAAQERGVVGETPNLAARLQAMAEPNTVLVADDTRKLFGDLFECRDLGPHELKDPRMAGLAGRESREPVRGPSSSDPRAPSRPSGGSRASSSALAAGAGGTRANHLDFRRAGDRQVAPDRGAPGPFDRRTIFGNALLLLAASRQ
jgi:class 3 adenylate cyclase